MARRRVSARASDFSVVLERGGRCWNGAGEVVRRYELPSEVTVLVCGRSLQIEGTRWDPAKGVILRVEELVDAIELLDLWTSRRASWFELRDQAITHHCVTWVRRPAKTKLISIGALRTHRCAKPDRPPPSFAEGETLTKTFRTPRACTDRFAHVADVLHKGETRLGPTPAKLGEVYAHRDGLRITARRDGFMFSRGMRETRVLEARDLRGLRILARLEASRASR